MESIEDHIHHFDDLDSEIYLTEEDHDMFSQVDDKTLTEELEQYHKGYMHAIDDIRKIKLRSRDVAINKGSLNPNHPSSSQTGLGEGNEKQKEPVASREVEKETGNVRELEQMTPVKLGKTPPMFNLQNKLDKLKVLIPFSELLRNQEYRDTITNMIANQGESHPNILELTEDNPTIILGSKIESMDNDDEEVPPFT